jgi:tetratricopeptide (TPR) repeat protein
MGMTKNSFFAAVLAIFAAGSADAQTSATPLPGTPAPSTSPSPGLMPGRPMAPTVSPDIAATREHLGRQQWAEAAELIEANLAKRPRDPQWRFLQGVLFAEIGKRSDAIQTFESLTEDFPELSEPFNNLAALYVEQNELHKARLLLERAIQNRPDYALAYENLADIYVRLAMSTYDKASKAKQPAPSIKLKLDHLSKTPAIRPSRVMTNR